jgi:hypothetical protein
MVRPGGQADGRPVRADLPGNRADDLDGEAGSVRDGAAIFIAARVGARGEELLDEIGVRAVKLDTIGASIDGGARRTAEVGDGPAHFLARQRARRRNVPHSCGGEHLCPRRDRGGCDGLAMMRRIPASCYSIALAATC